MVGLKSRQENNAIDALRKKTLSASYAGYMKSEWERWGGSPIKFRKFNGNTEEYDSELRDLHSRLDVIEDACQWQKIPRILLASNEIEHLFDNDQWFTRKCGVSPRKFFKSYQP